jgi:hypothetical protein
VGVTGLMLSPGATGDMGKTGVGLLGLGMPELHDTRTPRSNKALSNVDGGALVNVTFQKQGCRVVEYRISPPSGRLANGGYCSSAAFTAGIPH